MVPWPAELVPLYACILTNTIGAPGVDAGLPSTLRQIKILVSEMGSEPLVVGPSAELRFCYCMSQTSQSQCGHQAVEAQWTERGTAATRRPAGL